MLKKRHCKRFNILGTTLHYKKKSFLWLKREFSRDYFPVLDISKGGLKFLNNNKINAGTAVVLKLNIPEIPATIQVKACIRWIAKNPESSYRYQIGVSFNSYGKSKNENSLKVLSLLKSLEEKFT